MLCWHDKFFDILQQMDFKPSNADPDIWIRSSKDGTHYECIAVFVDDLYLQFNWKDGKSNPADIWSKHWEFVSIWPLLKTLLFWKGDTSELTAKTKGSDRISP